MGGFGGGGIPGMSAFTGLPANLRANGSETSTAGERIPSGAGLGVRSLTPNSTPKEVAAAIVAEARRRGYSKRQAIAILSTGLQESGLRPGAVSPNGLWRSIFQQDSGYRDRGNPNAVIAQFFDRLEHHGGPGSRDIWKSIFWLQQRPGEASAEAAWAHGRQNYLREIMSQEGRAESLYNDIVSAA
jgi:hypothetical protein